MALIAAEDKQTIQALFAKHLQEEVTLTYFTQHDSPLLVPGQECALCRETRELLEEVASLSEKVHLVVKDMIRDEPEARRLGVERIPAVLIQGQNKGAMRFFGVPAGYEFATLIEDVLDVSQGTTRLSEATRTACAAIDQDVHIQVFVTPTCPYCPRAARLAHQLAFENAHITADVVEISEFLDLAQRYHVQGVPKTVINDRVEMAGALPESRFVAALLQALQPAGETHA